MARLKYVTIKDSEFGIKVAVKADFLRDYSKAKRLYEKAEKKLETVDKEFDAAHIENKWKALKKTKKAIVALEKAKKKYEPLEKKFDELKEEAKVNPYNQEAKLRYSNLDKLQKDNPLEFEKKYKSNTFKEVAALYFITSLAISAVPYGLAFGIASVIVSPLIIPAITLLANISKSRRVRKFKALKEKANSFKEDIKKVKEYKSLKELSTGSNLSSKRTLSNKQHQKKYAGRLQSQRRVF